MTEQRASRGPVAFPRAVEVLLYGAAPIATVVTAPVLARALGPVERGQYGLAIAVSTFAMTLGAWGQAETYLSAARDGRFGYRQQSRIALVGGVLAAVAVLAALVALGLPVVLAAIAAVWIPLLNQTNLWRSVAVAGGRLRPPAVAGLLGALLRVVLIGALALLAALDAVSAVIATQVALTIAAALTVLPAARRVQAASRHSASPMRRLLASGGAIIAFDVLNAIALRSDLIVLQLTSTAQQLGVYAAPASLTTAVLGLSIAFKSRMQAAAVRGDGLHAVRRDAVVVLALGVLGAVVLLLIAPGLVELLFGPAYTGSVVPLRILGFAAVGLVMFDLAQGVLVVLAERRALIGVGAVSAGTTLLALLLLAGPFGAVGAASACAIAYGVAAVSAWLAVLRHPPRTASRPSLGAAQRG